MVEVLVTNLQNKAEHGVVFQCPSDTPPPRDSQNTRPSSLRRSHKGERSQNERHHPALCELVFSPLPPFRTPVTQANALLPEQEACFINKDIYRQDDKKTFAADFRAVDCGGHSFLNTTGS